MCAQTIDVISGGDRMIVGIGASGPRSSKAGTASPGASPTSLACTVAIMKKVWKRDGPVGHEGEEITLPYKGAGRRPGQAAEKHPAWPSRYPGLYRFRNAEQRPHDRRSRRRMDRNHLAPHTVKNYIPLLEEGIARRTDGKRLQDFVLRGTLSVYVNNDVKSAIDAAKPNIALYAGGMGAKSKNFHKDAMIQRGFRDAAERIQELFLAGRKDEAAAAVPDEYVDDENLIGPPERIKQRWRLWLDSGLNMMTFLSQAMKR